MIDFPRLLRFHLTPYKASESRQDWSLVNCPFCPGGDTGFHGAFSTSGGFNCWRCGRKDGIDALSLLLHRNWRETRDIIKEFEISGLRKQTSREFLSSLDYKPAPLTKKEISYLSDRGYDPEFLVQKYKLGSGGIAGDYAFRIKIPLFYNGSPISFTARDITGKQENRYMTLPLNKGAGDPKRLLYNLDNSPGQSAVVMEGTFDVMRFGDNGVCSFGTSMTEAQLKLLRRRFSRVLFLFDPEPVAQKKAKTYAGLLSLMGVEVEVIDTELGKDPGDMDDKEIRWLRKELGV